MTVRWQPPPPLDPEDFSTVAENLHRPKETYKRTCMSPCALFVLLGGVLVVFT